MILLIDNFDSFSYNLYQLIGSINEDIKVIRNNDMPPEETEKLNPSPIVISPGPGKPSEAGNCIEIIKALSGKYQIFGVCLGHQSIVEAFGGTVSYAKKLVHGKPEIIKINKNHPMFSGLDDTMQGARYHSLSALRENLPECLEVTAESSDGEIMAVAHKKYKIWGVQFHPESIMTPQGRELLVNFLK